MVEGLTFLLLGIGLLLGVVLPNLVAGRAISAPLVLVAFGGLIGLLPFPDGVSLSPLDHPEITQHISEITVLIALTGVGLALDRPLTWARSTWRRWSTTWRLIFIAMPLTIAATAWLGWWVAGLAPATALLLAAALAPTDPVLAADVQVEGPTTDQHPDELDEEDEVRFALTSEAGLNDGAAFPFLYAAIAVLAGGSIWSWAPQWIAWDLIARTVIGVVVGWIVGMALARIAFRAPKNLRVSRLGDPLLVVAAPFISYGLGEIAQGWAFLSVFVCAVTMRSADPTHEYHEAMHGVIERLERLFTLVMLLLIGASLTNGLLGDLTLSGAAIGVLLVFVVRPVVAWISLWQRKAQDFSGPGHLGPRERIAVAFFGVRGIGTIYYLAYATAHHDFPGSDRLWSIAAFTIALSVVVHGVAASPMVGRLDRMRGAAAA
ncbi:sodium:proton antiporter [Flexivirga sp. ID2601S]|uniref:Sodium:proton antiporter n=1 Tax=Flexivirga aerilata TaxID=1656889 RepID=A0A849AJZ3_9MICO|nr:sodium:proton antiporter [Flexivirga aerilata]